MDIRVDRLAKAKSKAYYTSPQWGGTGSGKTTEHSDRTAAAIEGLDELQAQLHQAQSVYYEALQRLNDEDLGANLIYMTVEYGKTTKELAAITGMTQGQVTYAMKKYRF